MNRGTFDLLFDSIVAALQAGSKEAPPEEQYGVHADRLRELPARDTSRQIANTYVYLGRLDRDKRSSTQREMTATYYVDLEVRSRSRMKGGASMMADEAGGIRLRYLMQQVIVALFGGEPYLGLEPGTIGKIDFSIEAYTPDEQESESIIVGSRMTITATVAYEPTEATGTPIDGVSVDASRWQMLIGGKQ